MGLARIGKIRLKAGGAEVRILRRDTPDDDGRENWRGKIVDNARGIASYSQPDSELVGYFVMGLFSDGSSSVAFRYDPKRSPIPRALLPAYIAEVLRRDMITYGEAVEVVNRTLGLPEPNGA